jgi:drug/metabolite transporter (DMT)-like permease
MLKPSPTQRTLAYQCTMRNIATTVILSVVATVLVFGIAACIAIKPFTAIGLAPILAGVSLIIRAIRGRSTHPPEPPNHPHHDPAD